MESTLDDRMRVAFIVMCCFLLVFADSFSSFKQVEASYQTPTLEERLLAIENRIEALEKKSAPFNFGGSIYYTPCTPYVGGANK